MHNSFKLAKDRNMKRFNNKCKNSLTLRCLCLIDAMSSSMGCDVALQKDSAVEQ